MGKWFKEDGDAALKSAQGGAESSSWCLSGGALVRRSRRRSSAHLDHPASSIPIRLPGSPLAAPAVAEFRSSPGGRSQDTAPAARSTPSPLPPGSPGLTWGRGPALPTAPSSRSARRSGLGAPAMAGRSGLGHRCHLRNRARRLSPGGRRGRSRRGAALPAGARERGWGRAGKVPDLPPRRPAWGAGSAALCLWASPGWGSTGLCAPGERPSGF